jgi:hypothetical protein
VTIDTTGGKGGAGDPAPQAALSFGPRWVRVATVAHGHERSPAVANGSEEPQVAGPLAQAAGMMQAGDSDCGPDGREGEVAIPGCASLHR